MTRRPLPTNPADIFDEQQRKLIINVTYKCNNHCAFCSIADRAIAHGDFDTQIRHIDAACAAGIRLLDIDGGEPTLYPRLFELLDYAISAGMTRITLTSNGRRLADPDFLAHLAAYPVNLLVSLHAADPELADRLTTQPGAFRQTLRGLTQALRHFPDLGVNTTLVRDNVDALTPLGALLVRLGVKTWNLQYYTPFGQVSPAFAPDPHHCGQILAGLIDRFGGHLDLQVINLPFCFMPPGYESYCLQDSNKALRRMLFADGQEVNLGDFLAGGRFKNASCTRCRFDAVCRGFWDYGPDPLSGTPYRIRMLDLIPGYACSAACVFCAVEPELLDRNMSTQAVKTEMNRAMHRDPQIVRIGGGEPTERADLPELLDHARLLGIPGRSIQTHGFRLADAGYLEQLVRAGLTKVNISVRGADRKTHEALTGVAGSFERLREAVRLVASFPELTLELDAILTRQTLAGLTDAVREYAGWGARRLNLWFVAPEGRARERAAQLIPTYEEAAAAVVAAHAQAEALGYESFRSYYIPYCFLKGHEALVWHPLEENATVVTPGSRFTLDRGTLDLGVKLPECAACAIAGRCFGVAPGYVELLGRPPLAPYTAEIPEFPAAPQRDAQGKGAKAKTARKPRKTAMKPKAT